MQVFFPTTSETAQAVCGYEVSASHCYSQDTVRAVCDRIEPCRSFDNSIPRLTWWDHKSTEEWVAYTLPEPEEVSGVDVYWYEDEPVGNCRLPENWNVQVRASPTTPWTNVATSLPVSKDRYNTVHFTAQKIHAIRLQVKLRPKYSGGILEWKLR